MSCVRPIDGYRVKGGGVIVVQRGGRPPHTAVSRVPYALPCGKCIGCRMEKARQWGIRCLHEAKQWSQNSYVTLTYNDEMMPPGGTLELRDVQLFMKRLRKKRNCNADNPIRFFLGGEYGDQNGRPHYHALLFNCGFGDLVFNRNNARGEPLYTSRELSDLWSSDGQSLGFCTVGAVTFDSAVYCAKYALKKVDGRKAADHYCVYDENGQCFDRRPEFAVMSRRPGIGAGYYEKYGSEVLALDSVVVDGREVRPPRFYDGRSEKVLKGIHDPNAILCKCKLCRNKSERKRQAVLAKADNTDARLRVKERLMVIAAEKKERKL
ncbi:replication initiator protein [robinz microvirus RP_30]|nr:replication initiator protein [robinz microvirus RP_29]UDN67488.1 replication initiator protein [robinz microvirus RP_30]